jgi:hypothetical protein
LGAGFGVDSFDFEVSGLSPFLYTLPGADRGVAVNELRVWASESRFEVWGLGFWVLGFEFWGSGFGVWGLGFGVWGLGFGVWVWGLRVRVKVSEDR